MDSELQALREARLSELKRGTNSGGDGKNDSKSNEPVIGSQIASFLEPQALERLTRVSYVRPDRAKAVEQYLKQLLGSGQVNHKINEDEIVQILNGVAREQNKQNETKIIFNRREIDDDDEEFGNKKNEQEEEDDDFFD